MRQERKHTDLPWVWSGSQLLADRGDHSTPVLVARAPFEPSPDDAEFIARAVNSHYPLVEALEEARTQVEILQERLGIRTNGVGTLAVIDAALAKARGQS